jgi:hypothetical protein
VKFKNILKKYDGKFDDFIGKSQNESPADIAKHEEHIAKLKKRLKKLEKFIKGKLKSFDVYQMDIDEVKLKQFICYSVDKGFYFKEGKHKNFSLRQSLGLFKGNESYIEIAEKLIESTENILEGILKNLSVKISKTAL